MKRFCALSFGLAVLGFSGLLPACAQHQREVDPTNPNRIIFRAAPTEVPKADPSTVIEGKVISISDGDTLEVLRDNETFKVRLEGIDAPEKGQAFSAQSKKLLSELCFGRPVTVIVKEKDRYGRLVGRVIASGADTSERMVAEGLAWHFLKYSSDPRLAALEVDARDRRRGLWGGEQPVPPWDYRKGEALERQRQDTIVQERDARQIYNPGPWASYDPGLRPIHNARDSLPYESPFGPVTNQPSFGFLNPYSNPSPSWGTGFYGDVGAGNVVVNRASGKYHRPGANALGRMNSENAEVMSRDQAEARGFIPSQAKN